MKVKEGGYSGEAIQTAMKRVAKGEGIAHTVIGKCNVGTYGYV